MTNVKCIRKNYGIENKEISKKWSIRMSLIMDSKDAPHPGAQNKAPDSRKTAVLTVASLKFLFL